MTGLWHRKLPDGFCCHDFRYRVIRAWEQRVDETLSGDMAILPLAPLADDAKDRLREIFTRLGKRFEAERELAERQALWNCTLGLAGLRYPKELIMTLSQEQGIMEESSYYHGILEKGETRGAQSLLLTVGTKRLGQPDARVLAAIDQIKDVAIIKELALRALEVNSWQDLLANR